MPVTPTYPGVYIEEVPSGVRTIIGVSTSDTAFVGYFARGPMNEAVQLFSFGDFERIFGGLRADSEASYAIQQFFLNGGAVAWVVRTANSDGAAGDVAAAAAIVLLDAASAGNPVLRVMAANEGVWGNNLRIDVDYNTVDPTSLFNLTVLEIQQSGDQQQVVNTEIFRNLVMDPTSASYAVDVINDGSKLIFVTPEGSPAADARPAQTGSSSAALPALTTLAPGTIGVSLNGVSAGTFQIAAIPATPTALARAMQSALRGVASNLSNATVEVIGAPSTEQYLRIKAGTANPADILTFTDSAGTLAADLGLNAAARANVQQYALGAAAAAGAQALPDSAQQAGVDGDLPGANDLIGNPDDKEGMYALLDVDLFNILCIPDTMRLSDADAFQVASNAISLCEEKRAFYILDVPQADSLRDEVPEIKQWLDDNATLRDKNAALYFPRPETPDALNGFRLRAIASSGTLAGLYARTDSARGVWKAPAGIEATLRGVQRLEYKLNDPENGVLNPLAINCLRTFPVYGNVSWGARTLVGADQLASEWKYIPVRRLALYIEESLYRGTQWVVFEPNDEPLWAQIRLNVGAFMQNLFRQGAFQGSTPREAYFVKCDRETTTQNDIDRGIVNIVVGFAPLKPAEFVIIKLQQIAGQIAT
jgi:phage tail sheath protein FI